jgi:hypothetical protein
MTVSVLRTNDTWWVQTPTGAAKIVSTAATTGEVLADRGAIDAAAHSSDTVPVDLCAYIGTRRRQHSPPMPGVPVGIASAPPRLAPRDHASGTGVTLTDAASDPDARASSVKTR